MHDAVREGHTERVRELLTPSSDPDAPPANINEQETKTQQTPLMAASLAGKAKVVEMLIELRADGTIGEEAGYTPLHGAGFQGRPNVAEVLLKHGYDPNDKHKDGYTPLHRACWGTEKRHTETVKMMLKYGAEALKKTYHNKTCLDISPNKKTKKVIERWGNKTTTPASTAPESQPSAEL